ncbi:MAG: 2OG-Fe(II) oxygenase family protein [Patescibacteria group bacterium]
MKTPINDLKTKGFVTMKYPESLRGPVENAVKSWKRFCALPTETKKGLPYSNGGTGVGYEFKDGVGKNADRKENFDVTLAGKGWVKVNAQKIESIAALNFAVQSTDLVGLLKPLVLDFAEQVEKTYSLKGFKQEVADSESAFFVRFIHYFGERNVGDETASAHVDQSGFTLHLFESAPGLQYLDSSKVWRDASISAGETDIIPSMQLQLRSEGKLNALCHRVIATLETAIGGRYSAVCFIQLKNTPRYDKDKQGRLQEREAGFNYDMPMGEFGKLFK